MEKAAAIAPPIFKAAPFKESKRPPMPPEFFFISSPTARVWVRISANLVLRP